MFLRIFLATHSKCRNSYFMLIPGGSLGLLTGMRVITGLELLFWFLAMMTRVYYKFGGKENVRNKMNPTLKGQDDSSLKRKLRKRNKDRKGRLAFHTIAKVSSTVLSASDNVK